jgi:hypothetical protein
VTASMLRRTEPVVSRVPRFTRRVQSKRAAVSTPWMRRFVRKSADAAIVSLRSASRLIAVTRTAPPRVGRRRAAHRSGPRDAIVAAWKGASIIVITSAPTAPA